MDSILNIEKQYIFQGMRVSLLPKECGETTPLIIGLRRPDVVTTGEQRTIVSDEKLKEAYDRYCEKAGIHIPYSDLYIANEDVTIRHVIGECGSSFKDKGYARVYCSTSGSTLKPIQTRTGANVMHALFPLYSDWKITEISVDWSDENGTIISINNIIQKEDNSIERVQLHKVNGILDLSSKYDKFLDAIEAAVQKSRTVSTEPVFYREIKKIAD